MEYLTILYNEMIRWLKIGIVFAMLGAYTLAVFAYVLAIGGILPYLIFFANR